MAEAYFKIATLNYALVSCPQCGAYYLIPKALDEDAINNKKELYGTVGKKAAQFTVRADIHGAIPFEKNR